MKIEDGDIYIGQTAKENWNLFSSHDDDAFWYHVKDGPSPYVICASVEKFNECARLCKLYSKFKNEPNCKIICTPLWNLQKGKQCGTVVIKNNSIVKQIKV